MQLAEGSRLKETRAAAPAAALTPLINVAATHQTHLALLRGINVGGKNKVEMARLKQTFERLGHQDVSTYINSGNVIFTATKPSRSDIEAAIAEDFGLELMVLVRDLSNMEAVNERLPRTWIHDKTAKTNVMFLDDPIDSEDLLDELGAKPAIDRVRYAPGAILWNVDAENWTKSGTMKLAGQSIYKSMTVRNVNTFRKLLGLMRSAVA